MLETLALQYSDLPEANINLISYGLTIVGGIFGGVTNRSRIGISRAPYFALSGLILLGISAVTTLEMAFIVQALAGGFFWIVVSAEMLASIVGGFCVARIAIARSQDAYGNGRRAPLAFIPFANLWLLFTPSKNEALASSAPTIPLLTGSTGVLLGVVMLGAGGALSTYAQTEGARRVEAAASAGVFSERMLGRILAAMAAEVGGPHVVDATTILLRVEAEEPELRYVYEVDPSVNSLSTDLRSRLLQKNCTYEGFTAIINAGAVIKHIYLRKDGTEVGMIEVTRQACSG